tara:strand:- start:506 stop:1528 length:1023 start_codon:yes stop_codon:yes gene_type:complete
MKILITGGCGFVGTNISLYLSSRGFKIQTLDNLSRIGSKYNLKLLKKNNIKNYKINIHDYKKIKKLPKYDLIIDCCAEAAVELSRKDIDKVINTNLIGTLNILKKIQEDNSKIIFLSTSRVFPIAETNKVLKSKKITSKLKIKKLFSEKDVTNGPKTIYGLTKFSSEMLIEEFSYAFNLKYIINRCGVISGPLQFGKQDQGFLSLWVWKHLNKDKMKYIGYGGNGHQLRDVLHIDDLCELIFMQIKKFNKIYNKLFTVGGSKHSYTSLLELTKICEKITNNKIKFSKITKTSIYDIPYYVTNNNLVKNTYNWKPKKNINKIVKDVFDWLNKNKNTLNKYF